MVKQWSVSSSQLDSILISFMSASDSNLINLANTQILVTNNLANNMTRSNQLSTSNSSTAQMSLGATGSYCQLVKDSLNKSASANVNCSSLTLSLKNSVSQVATVGGNGRDCNLDSSATVTVSVFQSSNQMLNVRKLQTPVDIWIPRNSFNAVVPAYQFINASSPNYKICLFNDTFMQYGINVTNNNSIHVQFKNMGSNSSDNLTIGYLVLAKFGSAPALNASYSNYDLWKLYCPLDTVTQNNDSYHLFFANMSTVGRFRGFINQQIFYFVTGVTIFKPKKV
jgi:hypothetical protein